MAIGGPLPEYLTPPHWLDKQAVSRDMQVGVEIVRGMQQRQQQERVLRLREEHFRLQREELERIAEGTVAASSVFSEMGRTGDYTNPELQSKFWATVQKYPKFANSPAFKDMIDTMQAAGVAKERFALESEKQTAISERNAATIQSRFDLMSDRLTGMERMEGIKAETRMAIAQARSELELLRDQLKGDLAAQLEAQRQSGRLQMGEQRIEGAGKLETQRQSGRLEVGEQRIQGASTIEEQRQLGRVELKEMDSASRLERMQQALENARTLIGDKTDAAAYLKEIQHDLDLERDARKPTTKRPEWMDLDDSDRKLMAAELEAVKQWRQNLPTNPKDPQTKKPLDIEAEYQRRLTAIESKYESRKKKRTVGEPVGEVSTNQNFDEYYKSLPSGAEYVAPDGVKRIKR